jgi:hypothetical protein
VIRRRRYGYGIPGLVYGVSGGWTFVQPDQETQGTVELNAEQFGGETDGGGGGEGGGE